MKTWIKYGLANTMIGVVVGLYITVSAIGDGYYVLTMAAHLALFIVGGILWDWIVKDEFNTTKIVITGFMTGTISHYITFVLLSFGANICHWTTGACTGSLGSILDMLTGDLFCLFSVSCFWLGNGSVLDSHWTYLKEAQ